MNIKHNLLRRQLRKHFGEMGAIPEQWQQLMELVDATYYEFDNDRRLLERAMELSSQELFEANSEMRAILMAFPDVIVRATLDGIILDYKAGSSTNLSINPEKVIGKRIQDVYASNIGALFLDTIMRVKETGLVQDMEYSVIKADKDDFYEARILPLLKNQIIAIIRNITARKQMEKELRLAHNELEMRVKERTIELNNVNTRLKNEIQERKQIEQELILSEARYRDIIEEQAELVIRILPDSTITFANEAYCRFFNQKYDEVLGYSLLSQIHQDDRSDFINLSKILSPDMLDTVHTLRVVRRDGQVCWQEWAGHAIYEDEHIIEYQAVGRDITKRKQAEEALQQSESNFRKLAETSPAYIFVERDYHLLYANSTCEVFTGYNRDELLIMDIRKIVHPDYREMIEKNAILRHQGEIIPPYEIKLVSKNGQEMWGYLHTDNIDYGGQSANLGLIVDISERKKMEEELLKAGKLESLGILAGGIAHDFNNILTVISGNTSLAKMIIDSENDVYELLTEIEKAALQARDLTQQLLTFSKGGAPVKETSSIQELLIDSASFVLRGSNVSCRFDIPDDLWNANVDKGQISQVINNLIINADQAMPEGGLIALSAENITLSRQTSLFNQDNKYVKITIKDQGIGIPQKHLDKIFDPYFTTKQKGHGLGLATCYSIISKHDGEIQINSQLGIGTTVDIYLPASPDQIIVKESIEKIILAGGKERILVMDDEAIVRDTLGKILNHLGYDTAFASDGQEAIDKFTESIEAQQPYDAVIMDLTVAGGMGGKDAVKKLLQIDSRVRVIVSSGYSNDQVMAHFEEYGFCGAIPKPYEIEGVNRVLYQVIHKSDILPGHSLETIINI